MPSPLPCDASLEMLQREADDRQRAAGKQQGDSDQATDLSLEDARSETAQKYGFLTWRQLEAFLIGTSPADKDHPENQTPDFLRLACLNYAHSDRPADWEQAREMLAADPDLRTRDIYSASCAGDVEAVRRFLQDDPESVNRRGGYFDWEPLLYACYSRLNLPDASTLAVARLLIESGADPNAYYMWGGAYRFTAVTGAFGEGEGGPVNQPEHEHAEALARLLLEAGADPNDSQALYNRMFADDQSICLKMLLEFGLGSESQCNWLIQRGSQLVPHPQQTLRYQLSWAINNHHEERARLLVEHGADLATEPGQTPPYAAAMLAGKPKLAEYLVAHGAERVPLDTLAQFACACMSGDEQQARKLLAEEPDLMRRLQNKQRRLLHDAAGAGRLEAVRLMADLGADLGRVSYNTPLHEAAWSGRMEVIKLLIEKGASPSLRDESHAATPLQWALYNGQREAVDYLAECDIDVFDAIAADKPQRVHKLIDEQPSRLEQPIGELRPECDPCEDDWMTPLASAVLRKRTEIVRLLLDKGASATVRDSQQRSLLERARVDSSPEITALLESVADG